MDGGGVRGTTAGEKISAQDSLGSGSEGLVGEGGRAVCPDF